MEGGPNVCGGFADLAYWLSCSGRAGTRLEAVGLPFIATALQRLDPVVSQEVWHHAPIQL